MVGRTPTAFRYKTLLIITLSRPLLCHALLILIITLKLNSRHSRTSDDGRTSQPASGARHRTSDDRVRPSVANPTTKSVRPSVRRDESSLAIRSGRIFIAGGFHGAPSLVGADGQIEVGPSWFKEEQQQLPRRGLGLVFAENFITLLRSNHPSDYVLPHRKLTQQGAVTRVDSLGCVLSLSVCLSLSFSLSWIMLFYPSAVVPKSLPIVYLLALSAFVAIAPGSLLAIYLQGDLIYSLCVCVYVFS